MKPICIVRLEANKQKIGGQDELEKLIFVSAHTLA